jgi:hypothetical protein
MLLNNPMSLVTHETVAAYLASRLPLQPNEIVTLAEIEEHLKCGKANGSRKVISKLIPACGWEARAYTHEKRLVWGYRPLNQPVPLEGFNTARFRDHGWSKSIAAYLDAHPEIRAVTTSTLVMSRVACPDARMTHADAIIAGNVLRSLGWQKVRHYQGKRGSTVYVRPVAAVEAGA